MVEDDNSEQDDSSKRDSSYKKALENARQELADLPRQKQIAIDFFNEREAHLKKIIEGLDAVCDPISCLKSASRLILDESHLLGLQESVAAVLRGNAPNILAPTTVRDELERVGMNTKNYSNPMATIHRALGRLAEDPKSRIVSVKEDGKVIGYKYTGVPPESDFLRRFRPPKRNAPQEKD